MRLSKNRLSLILIVLASAILFKCEMEKKSNGKNEVKKEWKEDKAQVKKDIQNLMDEIDDEITVIEENLENLSDKSGETWSEKLSKLKNTKADLAKKLSEVEEQTADEWISFKKEVEKGVEEIKLTLEKLGNEIEGTF